MNGFPVGLFHRGHFNTPKEGKTQESISLMIANISFSLRLFKKHPLFNIFFMTSEYSQIPHPTDKFSITKSAGMREHALHLPTAGNLSPPYSM